MNVNSHLATERMVETPDDSTSKLFDEKSISKIPRLLRGLGASILIVAISIFLFQGWENGNDTYRYLLLLGHTAALAIFGLISAQWLKESKGARLFLALALASVPANFAILGGFVYSQFALDGINVIYPAYVTWRAESAASALLLSGVSVAVLAPIIWLGFMVLTRRSAIPFTFLFLFINLMTLVPLRSVEVVGWMVLGLSLIIMQVSSSRRKTDITLKTPEGMIARFITIIPLGVILGRTMWLYSTDVFLLTILALVSFIVLRHVATSIGLGKKVHGVIDQLSLLPAVLVGSGVAYLTAQAFPTMTSFYLPVFCISVAMLSVMIAMRAAHGGAAYRRLAVVLVTLGMLANLMIFGGVIQAAICLAIGLGIMVYGYMIEQRLIFVLGLLTLVYGLVFQISYAIQFFQLGSWASLAALGVTAILVGSAIERHGEQFKQRLTDWGQQFRSWEY